jgi:hypothetical protein
VRRVVTTHLMSVKPSPITAEMTAVSTPPGYAGAAV